MRKQTNFEKGIIGSVEVKNWRKLGLINLGHRRKKDAPKEYGSGRSSYVGKKCACFHLRKDHIAYNFPARYIGGCTIPFCRCEAWEKGAVR